MIGIWILVSYRPIRSVVADARCHLPARRPLPCRREFRRRQEKHLIDPMLPGSLNPKPLPPLKNPDAPSIPAKELFARKSTPFPRPPRSIGGDFNGCLAGAESLPITGPTWQVMRLSRNRNWGNPQLIRFIERFATNARK